MANTLIHETRRLQFPLDTLVDALIELEDKQGHWPAKATVVGASIHNPGEGDVWVVLSIDRPESGQVSERRYSLPAVAAAIVNYCLTMRVPIPRNSTKSIQVLPDGVALMLENTVMLQSRHEELSTLPAGSVPTGQAAAEPGPGQSAPEPAETAPDLAQSVPGPAESAPDLVQSVPDTEHPEASQPPQEMPPDAA